MLKAAVVSIALIAGHPADCLTHAEMERFADSQSDYYVIAWTEFRNGEDRAAVIFPDKTGYIYHVRHGRLYCNRRDLRHNDLWLIIMHSPKGLLLELYKLFSIEEP